MFFVIFQLMEDNVVAQESSYAPVAYGGYASPGSYSWISELSLKWVTNEIFAL